MQGHRLWLWGSTFALVPAVGAALTIGRYPLQVADILTFLQASVGLQALPEAQYDRLYNLIVEIRLPRTLAAVLVGIISSGLFAALLAIVKYLADPDDVLPNIVYWLMGSLARADLAQTGWLFVPVLGGVLLLSLMGRVLDVLSMGDDEARSLGVPVHLVRACVIVTATMISALTVSVAGMIGWVGLIIPHIARLLIGPGNAALLPFSACLGALFLLGCDALARSTVAAEIPIGIITELVGIPVFLLVLNRLRRGWA